jgi:type IX secretion system PorP/SprF family membrane protein
MKRVYFILFGLLSFSVMQGQDIHFSQFYMAPLTQNPALAGALNNAEAYVNYKNQWTAITNPYKTFAVSGMARLGKPKKNKGFWAVGLNFFNDQSGDGKLTTTLGDFTLSYQIPLSKYQKLGLGLQSGFGQMKLDYSNLQWGSQYGNGAFDPNAATGENTNNTNFGFLDFSSGILWSFNNTSGAVKTTNNVFNKGCVGFSVYHINQPLYSFARSGDRLKMKYVFHGNYLFSLPNSKIALNPGFMYYSQGPARELLIGGMVRYNILPESKYSGFYKGAGAYLGAYLRAKDAVIISAMLELSQFTVGFSYDVNTSSLRPASNGRGGMEVSIRITGHGPFANKSGIKSKL